jgi:hypothetical protein
MTNNKPGNDPIKAICVKLVQSHEDRKKSVELLKAERAALVGKLPGFSLSDMPKSFSNDISDPVHRIYIRLEQLDYHIAEEQKRIEAVEAAIKNIGAFEKNPAIRKQIRKSILENIKQGGYLMPYEYANFPEKYTRDQFYKQRNAFLYEIARNLYLTLKTQ